MSRKLNEIDRNLIIKMFLEGEKLSSIGDILGITRSAVCYHAKRLGLPKRNKDKKTRKPGDIVGRWELIERTVDHKNRGLWKCKCSCGEICLVQSGSLNFGKSKHCKKCNDQWNSSLIPNRYWAAIICSAKARNLEFSLERESMEEMLKFQKFRCALSGLEIGFSNHWKEHNKPKGSTASIDRIDSSKGYIDGNVWWVNKQINMMKQSLTVDEFLYFCKSVTRNLS